MNLRDYLHFNRLTNREFSAKLGITENYLGAIKRGEQVPSTQLAKLIELITGGEVKMDSKQKKKPKKKPKKKTS